MIEEKQKKLKLIAYIAIFCFSFVFFAYLTFPYGVLKEALTSRASKAIGVDIRIEEFGPRFPLGFSAKNIRIQSGTGPTLKFEQVKVSLSILKLLIGTVGLDLEIIEAGKGYMDIGLSFGILKLIDQNFIPKYLAVESDKLSLGPITAFVTHKLSSSPDVNPLIAPLLTKITFNAALNTNVQFDIDPAHLAQSQGVFKLNLQNASFFIDDPALFIDEQKFEKASIDAVLKNGTFEFANTSAMRTQDLTVEMQGQIKLKNDLAKSNLDIKASLKLENALKDQYGFLLKTFGSGDDGGLKFQYLGTLEAPAFTPI